MLIRADPGTGKTWSMQQLAHTICEKLLGAEQAGVMLVPLLVPVQQLAKHLAESNALLSWVDDRFKGEQRSALHVAYGLRALIVLLDGVDEAAGKRKEVEALVLQRLVQMGQRVVVSSRPEGVELKRYDDARFVIMNLKPLSDEQQREAIEYQLKDSTDFDHLSAVAAIRREHDRIDREVTFQTDAERYEIEHFARQNRFFASDGTRDHGMRQRRRDGSGFVRLSTAMRVDAVEHQMTRQGIAVAIRVPS